jgi:prepilin-type processing-associated H-X9-DG protein
VQLNPPISAHYEIWLSPIYPYLDAGPSDPGGWNSALLLNKTTIAHGCPEWKVVSAYSPGYGMNYFPCWPQSAGTTDEANASFFRDIARQRCSYQTQRILLGDSTGPALASAWLLPPALPTAFTAGSGDALRHAGRRANYCFFDLHCQTIAAASSPWLGVGAPSDASWSP